MLAAVLVAAVAPAVLGADSQDDRELDLRVTLVELDRALSDIQRDIDEQESHITDADTAILEVDGVLVPFDLGQVDALLPMARSMLAGEPELRDLLAGRNAMLAAMLEILDTTPDDVDFLAAVAIKALLRQDEAEKQALLADRLATLQAEFIIAERLYDALESELDELESGAGGEDVGEFPPVWLAGRNGEAVVDRYGPPPAPEESTWYLERPASNYREDCWSMDDGLHYCARRPYGWIGVYMETPSGFLWYDLQDRTTCELEVTGKTVTPSGVTWTNGLYGPCPGNIDGSNLYQFGTVGLAWGSD